MGFFSKAMQSYSKFMNGRYGNDSLNRFLTILWLLESVLNLFFHSVVLYFFGVVLGVVVFFRMLSKNVVKRRLENAVWYDFTCKAKSVFQRWRVRVRDRKVAHFFKCPRCKAPIRMPKKIGKFNIRCSKCGYVFQKEFKK